MTTEREIFDRLAGLHRDLAELDQAARMRNVYACPACRVPTVLGGKCGCDVEAAYQQGLVEGRREASVAA